MQQACVGIPMTCADMQQACVRTDRPIRKLERCNAATAMKAGCPLCSNMQAQQMMRGRLLSPGCAVKQNRQAATKQPYADNAMHFDLVILCLQHKHQARYLV
jgi:hypothetical protein